MKMKNIATALILIGSALCCLSQGNEFCVKYRITPQKGTLQNNTYIKNKSTPVVYEKGWVETKKIGDKIFEIVLSETIQDTIITFDVVKSSRRFLAGEIKFTDSEPNKVYFNSLPLKEKHKNNCLCLEEDIYNKIGYITIENNGNIRLIKRNFSVSTLTIPFAIRRRLNDTIRGQASADINLGFACSYNLSWVNFKNRNLKAVTSIYGLSAGIGLGFSRISLNSANTSLSNTPLIFDESGLAFTIAGGVGLKLNGVDISILWANDLAITGNVRDWNYFRKPYLGIGFGLNLKTLGL